MYHPKLISKINLNQLTVKAVVITLSTKRVFSSGQFLQHGRRRKSSDAPSLEIIGEVWTRGSVSTKISNKVAKSKMKVLKFIDAHLYSND
jgi:hypothetical protein